MKKLLTAVLLCALALPAFADRSGSAEPRIEGDNPFNFTEKEIPDLKSFVGMKVRRAGALCTNPHTAHDLIGVIDKEEMFLGWLNGYVVSGYCGQVTGPEMTLVQKWKTTNTTYDGYYVELWEVEMEDGARMWAIIFPRLVSTIKGLGA